MAKKIRVEVKNWEGVNKALASLREGAQARARLNAAADGRIAAIQAERDEAVGPLDSRDKAVGKAIEAFVVEHRADLGDRQTMELTNGIVGFRATPPKVAVLNKKWSLDKAVEAMRTKGSKFAAYVRAKFDVDKDGILTALRAEKPRISEDDLAIVGLRIQRGENFVCEPKADEARTGA